jgi:hypothetical protein
VEGQEVVLCGGVWSAKLAKELDLKLPMQAGKGYSLTLANPKQLPELCSICTEARLAVTPMDGALRVGGTMEMAGIDESITPRRVRGITRAFPDYFPAFSENDFAEVKPWSGLRPVSPDGMPYIGRTQRWKNLTVATGHAMMGSEPRSRDGQNRCRCAQRREIARGARSDVTGSFCMKIITLFFLTVSTAAFALDRPKLQIINAGEKAVEVFWIAPDGKRVPNGKIEPGKDSIIGTTLGHRFVIVDDGKETEVVSQGAGAGFRHDPKAKDGVPAFYTQVVRAHGYPICGSAKVSPYALKEAAYLADLMLAKRPDVREAMIASGSRLCILAHDEFTTDQPEWAWLEKVPVPGFESMSIKDYRDARARGMGGSATDPFCSCAEENLLAYEGDPYSTECIFIHEFAHNIHLRGLRMWTPPSTGA